MVEDRRLHPMVGELPCCQHARGNVQECDSGLEKTVCGKDLENVSRRDLLE